MHKQTSRLYSLVNNWFSKDRAKNFNEYKQMKQDEIWNLINPNNFKTPDDALRLCFLLYSKKQAVEDLEEQKRLAEEEENV